jgi:hypothetical protein
MHMLYQYIVKTAKPFALRLKNSLLWESLSLSFLFGCFLVDIVPMLNKKGSDHSADEDALLCTSPWPI